MAAASAAQLRDVGAGNVAAVFARWAALPDAPFRALVFMANVALDNDTPPRYFGGWEPNAHAIGYPGLPSAERAAADPEAQKARDAAFRATKRALAALLAAGAIERLSGGHSGHTAEYALRLMAANTLAAKGRKGSTRGTSSVPLLEHLRGTSTVPLRGTSGVPLRGTPSVRKGGHPVSGKGDTGCPPKEKEEKRGTDEEEDLGQVVHLQDRFAPASATECIHGDERGLQALRNGQPRCPQCRRRGITAVLPQDGRPAS